MEGNSDSEKLTRQRSDYSGANAWLDAHCDPVASLYTFSSCIGEYTIIILVLYIYIYNIQYKWYVTVLLFH